MINDYNLIGYYGLWGNPLMYNKKIIIFIICIILVISSVSSINGVKIEKRIPDETFYYRNILFVGVDGPNNYSKIQDAIDDASDDDTVFVYHDTYYETIIINRSINLKGEDKTTTIINGSEIGVVLTINADFVNITGFTFQKSNLYNYAIEVKSDFNNISNNIFIDNGYGIYTIGTNNNTIKGNTFSNHRWICIYVLESNYNIITDNYFNNNDPGSGVSIGYSDFSIISNNYFTWTKYGISTGFCDNLVIANNNLIGKSIETAIDLSYTNSSIISDNNIDSWTTGIQIDSSNYNIITGNNIINCDFYGYFIYIP
jgi:parallel beta-helix repeat protein